MHDPVADADEALHEYGVELARVGRAAGRRRADPRRRAQAAASSCRRRTCLQKIVRQGCIVDVKAVLDAAALRREGVRVWRL